jgi:hypothetical protein
MNRIGLVIAAVIVSAALPTDAFARLFDLDCKSLVSRADLHYTTPATRSEEGMPLGNGRTGTLVWTTPGALRMLINRNDVFATASTTRSFPRAHTDYASGCAYVDVHVGDAFGGKTFEQHLSVYDGVVTVTGDGVTARVLAWQTRDVIAIEIDDRREKPSPIQVDLRMLRYANQYRAGTANDLSREHAAVVQTGAHVARMKLDVRPGSQVVLTQEFSEGEHYCASAVATQIVGRESRGEYFNESTVRTTAPPRAGKCVVLIASAATFDPKHDVAADALAIVEDAYRVGLDRIVADNEKWWADFWSRGFVRLRGDEWRAELVEQNYHYLLYVMASCSRGGEFPAHFNGMLWYTNGDMRAWGSLYWWANQSCYYNGLLPANRVELLDPLLAMYWNMRDACAAAAREQWGSKGIWIPETAHFNGPEPLPPAIAEEMRELYLVRKPWGERSKEFDRFVENVSSFPSRWNWIAQGGRWADGQWVHEDKGSPPFGHTTHIFGTTAKVALLFWQKYEYTLDEAWLRDRAYPMLRDAAEFYRHFPNVTKESDGKYHIRHTNSNEPAWGVRDSDEDIAAIRGIAPIAIRAAEVLGVDAELRSAWREFLGNLAPLPTSDMADALKPADYGGPRVFVKGREPAAKRGGMLPDGNTLPHWNFELVGLASGNEELNATAGSTLEAYLTRGGGIGPAMRVGTLSRVPIAAAQMGRSDAVQFMLPAQLVANDSNRNGAPGVLRNRMALREGAGATECERLGRVAEALHTALLQRAPVIRIAPACPTPWDADFTLLARGNFLVSASIEKGMVAAVEIESRGGELRLWNPWPGKSIALYRNGGAAGEASGEVLTVATGKGDVITFVPAGETIPAPRRIR